MLVSFSVENFRSFKEEATLNFVATDEKKMRDSHVFTPVLKNNVKSFDLLRSAVIYGPNAGGKSNFFKAFAFMSKIIRNSTKGYDKLPVIPFILNKKTEKAPTSFEAVIVIEGVRYQYGFSTTNDKIHSEWLLAFPKGRTQTWFERTYNKKTKKYDYVLGDDLKGQKKVWCEATNPTALFLSTAVQLNSTQLKPIYDWFAVNMWFMNADDLSQQLSLEYCEKYGSEKITNFLKAADFAIEDIRVVEVKFPSESSIKGTTKISDSFISSEAGEKKHFEAVAFHKTNEGEYIGMTLPLESDGTQRMFALASLFLYALEQGVTLMIDELNQKLHPHLILYLINIFNNPKINPNNAQLIFTTHAASLLKEDIFRRDQIWFCERDVSQASTLFPLTDFKLPEGDTNFEDHYLSGSYGALPFIGEASDFIENSKDA